MILDSKQDNAVNDRVTQGPPGTIQEAHLNLFNPSTHHLKKL